MNKQIKLALYLLLLFGNIACTKNKALIVDRGDFFYDKANSYRYSKGNASYTNNRSFFITIKEGDTLSEIAEFYNMEPDKIIQANNLKSPYQLKIGSKLKIPKKLTHKVKYGDTLFRISKLYNIKLSTLAQINNIKQPYNIRINQEININVKNQLIKNQNKYIAKKPKETSKIKKFAQSFTNSGKFSWPLDGQIVSSFGPKKGGLYNDGINIKAGTSNIVKASQDGVVAYVGNELKGYGNLIIIKHEGGWITAYAHLSDTKVKKGFEVKKGQQIANAGTSGNVDFKQLYFSLRKGRKAVDPQKYLR